MSTPEELSRLEPGKVRAFASSLGLVAQQRKSRCISGVFADLGYSEKGVSFTDELLESFEAEDFDGDIAPTKWSTVDQNRREARFRGMVVDRMVGTRERAEKLVDPTNSVVISMGAALERKRDRRIIGQIGRTGGIFGDAIQITQEGDPTIVSFPSERIIPHDFNDYWKGKADGVQAPSQTPTFFTRNKIAQAKILLDDSFYADMTMDDYPTVMLEERDLQNFCTSEETINKDYISHDLPNLERLRNGEIGVYKGLKFIKVAKGTLPRVPGQTGRFYMPVYYRDVMLYKERPLVQTKIEQIQSMRWRWGAYYEAQTACLRTEDEGMVWIEVER